MPRETLNKHQLQDLPPSDRLAFFQDIFQNALEQLIEAEEPIIVGFLRLTEQDELYKEGAHFIVATTYGEIPFRIAQNHKHILNKKNQYLEHGILVFEVKNPYKLKIKPLEIIKRDLQGIIKNYVEPGE